MRIGIISGVIGVFITLSVHAQKLIQSRVCFCLMLW